MKNVSRLKVAAGYTVLLAVLIGSLYYVQREVEVLARTEEQDTQWMDSLATLLREKDENTVRMLHTLTDTSDSLIATSLIDSLVTARDTVLVRRPRVQRRVVRHFDTIVTPHERKGFFRRLRDAFAPPKQDSVLHVNTRMEYSEDTLLESYNPVDTLQARLRTILERERRMNTLVRQRRTRLQRVNTRLSARIDTLLRHYQDSLLSAARVDAQRRQSLRRHSAETIGGIAMGAVLVAALFSVLIGRDITRSNRYRRQLEEARRQAEELLSARERMMLAITHDFKAPLGSIMGYTELLERLTTDARQRFYLDNMQSSASHLLKLITDLLDFHRLDLHKADINRVPFYPARLLDEVRVSFEPLIAAKGLRLHCEVAAVLQSAFINDPLRLRQIVGNLLSNAVKFTDRGDITLQADYQENRLVISVSDTGRGMASADRDRIFQAFTRLPGAQGQEGFGLGLSIVRMLVQLLGGEIDVQSTLGEGSTFTVRLPLESARAAVVPSADADGGVVTSGADVADCSTAEPVQVPAVMSSATEGTLVTHHRVLLIDDDRIQLMLTVSMLSRGGIEAVACQQVDELLDALRTQAFDVLLTDVQMPAINGFELVQLLRASNIPQACTLPIVAVTARSDVETDELTAHGFAGCLHKPFSLADLLAELHRIIPASVSAVSNGVEMAGEVEQADGQPVPIPDGDASIRADFSALTAFSADDPDTSRAILQSFISETRLNMARLDRAAVREKMDELSAVAHKMLPLFTLLGTTRLVDLLRRLEKARGEDYYEELGAMAREVCVGVKEVLTAAEVYCKRLV